MLWSDPYALSPSTPGSTRPQSLKPYRERLSSSEMTMRHNLRSSPSIQTNLAFFASIILADRTNSWSRSRRQTWNEPSRESPSRQVFRKPSRWERPYASPWTPRTKRSPAFSRDFSPRKFSPFVPRKPGRFCCDSIAVIC